METRTSTGTNHGKWRHTILISTPTEQHEVLMLLKENVAYMDRPKLTSDQLVEWYMSFVHATRAVRDISSFPTLLWVDEHGVDVKSVDTSRWDVDGKLTPFLMSASDTFYVSRSSKEPTEPRGVIAAELGGYEKKRVHD